MPRNSLWVEADKRDFLKSLALHFAAAVEQERTDQFFLLLFPIWFDRYPISEFSSPSDPDHRNWMIGREQEVRNKVYMTFKTLIKISQTEGRA